MLPTVLRRKGDLTHWFDDIEQFLNSNISKVHNNVTHFPRVDVYEDDQHYYIDADLPGLDKKDITLTIENNIVTLSGVRDDKREEKKGGYYRLERQSGRFERSIHLGENGEYHNAHATFEKGVLTIVVPKKEEAKPKQLDIKIK